MLLFIYTTQTKKDFLVQEKNFLIKKNPAVNILLITFFLIKKKLFIVKDKNLLSY